MVWQRVTESTFVPSCAFPSAVLWPDGPGIPEAWAPLRREEGQEEGGQAPVPSAVLRSLPLPLETISNGIHGSLWMLMNQVGFQIFYHLKSNAIFFLKKYRRPQTIVNIFKLSFKFYVVTSRVR